MEHVLKSNNSLTSKMKIFENAVERKAHNLFGYDSVSFVKDFRNNKVSNKMPTIFVFH